MLFLQIPQVNRKKRVAVFEENTKGQPPDHYLMGAANKIRNFPIIVNYCKSNKQQEFNFDKPDYRKLLPDTSFLSDQSNK